jgi:hypothetical protein
MTDQEVLAAIDREFGPCPRPEHFTNSTHCCECLDHDDLLRARDRVTLTHADVGNQGWDPICFITADGFAYYKPALAKLALGDTDPTWGWYGGQLAFQLRHTGPGNDRWQHCTGRQREAVAKLLEHLIDSRAPLAEAESLTDVLLAAWQIWSLTALPN